MEAFFHGTAIFFAFVIPAAVIIFTFRALVKIPDELFRKILHFILLGAYIPLCFGFETWWMAAALTAVFAIVLYPILTLASRIPGFTKFTTQRKEGEFISSMVLALATMAISVSLCWGVFGDRYLVLACVYAWGVGDAFAALIGKQFGKHKTKLPFADPRKSWEGSAAMFLSAVLSVLVVLLVRGGLGFGACLFVSLLAATATTYMELITKDGLDTITCPAVAMAVILPLIKILGG